jgi:predicted deacetylase
MTRKVVISIHDVTPRHFDRVRQIVALLDELGLASRFSMLVVPDFWNDWPLAEHPDFCSWLKQQSESGVEMILHGFTHLDETDHTNLDSGWKAKHLTAGEGEFSGLGFEEAMQKLQDGETVLEKTCHIQAQGFCAPAWLYSEGALLALKTKGYAFAEDHMKVWSPLSGAETAKGPVVSYASRSRSRILSSLLWSRIADWLLKPLPITRIAIHPHDFDIPVLEREITRMLRSQLKARTPVYYRDLVSPSSS